MSELLYFTIFPFRLPQKSHNAGKKFYMRQHFTAPVRLQPGFGSITYTGPNRRKPYLARRTQAKGHKADSYIGYFPTWYDAYTAILNDHVSHPSGEKKNSNDITLGELYNSWSSDPVTKQRYTAGTLKSKKSYWKHLSAIISKPADSFTAQSLTDYLYSLPVSDIVRRNIRVLLNLLYSYGRFRGLVETNPAADIDLYTSYSSKPRTPFTAKEVHLIEDAADCPEKYYLILLLYTGMRPAEAEELAKENIHLDKRYIVSGVKTAAGKNRVIPLHRKAKKALVYLLKNPKAVKYMSRQADTIRKRALRFLESIGVTGHIIYETRHTFISQAQMLGLPEVAIQKIVGHASGVTNVVYTHLSPDYLLAQIDRFHY